MIFQAKKYEYEGEGTGGVIVDRSISFEQRVGAKWVRVMWPTDADEPEVRWRLEQNGSPASSIDVDVRAGARRVQVSWPAGRFEAKVRFWDYDAQEDQAQPYTVPMGRTSDVTYNVPPSGER